jgi:hypothetical protein
MFSLRENAYNQINFMRTHISFIVGRLACMKFDADWEYIYGIVPDFQ